jgi:hypothetical protein
VTRGALRAALAREGLAFEEIERGPAWLIVVPRLGARILGAGIGDENALWVAPRFSARDWDDGGNAGGQRTWIAPELGPRGFFGREVAGWRVPPELDPAAYAPVPEGREDEGWHAWRTTLGARAADGCGFPIAITRAVRLGDEQPPGKGVVLRAELRTTLENTGQEPIEGRVGLWNIVQVPAVHRGLITIPLRPGTASEAVHPYFAPLPRGVLAMRRSSAHLRVQGGTRYKVGVSTAAAMGEIGFVGRSRMERGRIRVSLECPVDPRGLYLDRPPLETERGQQGPGDALQAYSDSGTGAMAFAEIEAHAPAVTLAPGERQVFDVVLRVEGPARR